GVPAAIAAQTLVLPYNDEAALRLAFASHPGRIAAVITEAAAANMGVVVPAPGFNRAIVEIAHADGALVVSDEVLTGFRVHPGGLVAAVGSPPTAAGVRHVTPRAGNLFSVAFGLDAAPADYDRVRAQEAWRYPPFFHAMLDAGISLPPSVFEAWFLTAAHDDAALARIEEALPAAARAAASATPPRS